MHTHGYDPNQHTNPEKWDSQLTYAQVLDDHWAAQFQDKFE